MKVIEKIKKCCVWNWCLFNVKLEGKKWDYAVVGKADKAQQVEGTVSFWIDKNKNIALIKIYRHGIDKLVWELPRGGAEKWLTSEENALKEFQEEIGVLNEPINIKKIGTVAPDSGIFSWYVDIVFLNSQ